jgi:hypothetical protein
VQFLSHAGDDSLDQLVVWTRLRHGLSEVGVPECNA